MCKLTLSPRGLRVFARRLALIRVETIDGRSDLADEAEPTADGDESEHASKPSVHASFFVQVSSAQLSSAQLNSAQQGTARYESLTACYPTYPVTWYPTYLSITYTVRLFPRHGYPTIWYGRTPPAWSVVCHAALCAAAIDPPIDRRRARRRLGRLGHWRVIRVALCAVLFKRSKAKRRNAARNMCGAITPPPTFARKWSRRYG
jgi:hypothetical protein